MLKLKIKYLLMGILLSVGFTLVLAGTINTATTAQDGDVITAQAWNDLLSKIDSQGSGGGGSPCSSEGAIGCEIVASDISYVSTWSCIHGFDSVNKRCKGPAGTCGSSNLGYFDGIAPSNNLCSAGTPIWIDNVGTDLEWNWGCQGLDGGSSVECKAINGPGTWSSESYNLDFDGGGWTNYSARNSFPSSVFTSNGTQVRITFMAGNGGMDIGNAYIGEALSQGSKSFNGVPTQITFNGGNSDSGSLTTNETIVSDEINFNIDQTKSYIVTFYMKTGSSTPKMLSNHGLNGFASWQYSGNLSSQTDPSMSSDDRIIGVKNIEWR